MTLEIGKYCCSSNKSSIYENKLAKGEMKIEFIDEFKRSYIDTPYVYGVNLSFSKNLYIKVTTILNYMGLFN